MAEEVKVTSSMKGEEKHFLDAKSFALYSDRFKILTDEDENPPLAFDILSMEVSGSDTLIITDLRNHCIKSFYKRNNQQHYSRIRMQSEPRCITNLEDNKIAVTFPQCKQIVVLSVTPDLKVDSTLLTEKEYCGITALTPTTLAASSLTPPCVDILDMSGNVMRSISPLHKGQGIMKDPNYLCTTRQGNILISDYGVGSVVCVTPKGEVVFNYSPKGDRTLMEPRGITRSVGGHILVADFWYERIIQLSESGEFVRVFLESKFGIYKPFGLHWDESVRIYVTELMSENIRTWDFKFPSF